jgi:hypothetical protein
MRIFHKEKLIISLLLLFFITSFGVTFAFWASSIEGSSNDGSGTVDVGLWVPTGFFGVTQDGAGDMITLDEIGEPGYPYNGDYIQMSDIDWGGNPFTPIGYVGSERFNGSFYGNGFSISNVDINITIPATGSNHNIGLFVHNNGLISGVSLIDITVTVSITATGEGTDHLYMGGITGRNTGSIYYSYVSGSINGTMTRSTTTNNQTINSTAFVGGISGINTGSVHNSYSVSNVTSISNATTTHNTSSATAAAFAGGLIGRNQAEGSIINTYSTGNVTSEAKANNTGNRAQRAFANSYAGGLIGRNNGPDIANSFATGAVQARTQTTETGTANRYFGNINGFGTSMDSYYLENQSTSGFVITPGATGTNIENTTDSTILSATEAELRSEAFVTTIDLSNLLWSPNDWIFNPSYYPRLKRNKY